MRSEQLAEAVREWQGQLAAGEFDPAGFMEGKDKLEVYRLREAELAHGRVSMPASRRR